MKIQLYYYKMYLEKLGIPAEQQAQVDHVFIDTTLAALNQKTHYWERAALVRGDLADELEAVQTRVHDEAHDAMVRGDQIPSEVVQMMGKIAFIDTLALPSSEILKPKVKAVRAHGDYNGYRRLFRKLPPK